MWVLIGKKTYIDLNQATNIKSTTPMFTPSLPTSPIPDRTDSQESEESSQTGSTNSYFSSVSQQPKVTQGGGSGHVHTMEPSKGGVRRPVNRLVSSDASMLCFTKDESQDSTTGSDDSGVVTTMLNFLNFSGLHLFRGNSPNEERIFDDQNYSKAQQRRSLLTPQEEYKPPSQKKHISPSKSYTYGIRGGHSKTQSWHGHTEYEKDKEQYIKAIRLPITLTPVQLRVQDVNLESLRAIWDIHEYNEIFVHPLSLPELYQVSKGQQSYLVVLSLPITPIKMKSKGEGDGKYSESIVSSNVPTPNARQSPSMLPEKPKKDDQGVYKLFSRLTEYSETSSPPVITISSASNPLPPIQTCPDSFITNNVVCHLRFATAVKFNNRRKRSTNAATLEEVSVSREGSSSPTLDHSPSRQSKITTDFIPILPNHVLMSDLMKQQLGIKTGQFVRLNTCQENWRVDCRRSRVSLYLYPIITKKVCNEALYILYPVTLF